MDMKELFENGCFTPAWTEQEKVNENDSPVPKHKNLDTLLDELSQIKTNIENLQAKSWYLERLRQYNEHGLLKD